MNISVKFGTFNVVENKENNGISIYNGTLIGGIRMLLKMQCMPKKALSKNVITTTKM